jgi:DNA polymerase
MNKQKELDKVAEEIEACGVCKVGKVGVAVPGEGDADASVVFIGEAPGKTEAKTGRPFVGRSGQLLRKMIQGIGLNDEKDVYITSPVKYLPEKGTPSPGEIAHGRIHLMKQLEIIDPKVIVLMGSVAAQGVLEQKIPVKTEHGKTIKKDGKTYFITVHPAAGLRFPPLRKIFIQDFSQLKMLLAK